MAENEMKKIVDAIKHKWAVEDVAILHRIGRLNIGEISVLIAIASPHRAEAFDACRYAIDRLKEKVPIWKKEVGENGETWIEGPK
jgi:molybdopterin synthase catalytic subunit